MVCLSGGIIMARTIKDVFCRYKTQQGYLVHRKAGWDTHGLPVELGVEKKLGITKEDIGKKISIEEYNRTCREAVMEFTGKWEDLTRKMGYWVNMDDPYITYDNKYIETLWWLLKQLFDKGLLYKGYTIQPYSPAAGTGLSTHELNQPGCYRDVKDTTCTSQFRVIRDAKSEKLFEGIEGELYFLAWTTTPWTLPSNTALAVGPAIEYVKVKCRNPYTDRPQTVILAKELLGSYFTKKMEGTYEIMEGSWKGPELEGIRYEQLIPWVKPEGDAFRVIVGDYVTTSDGTGIVHIAPTFGADDDRVAKAAGIPPLFMVDRAGKNQPMVDRQGKFFLIEDLDPEFVKTHVDAAKYGEYAGRYVKNAYDERLSETDPTLDIDIAVMLKAENKAFKIEKHTHSYPHCWRTDKPVLYYPLDSWFIRTTALRERMIELNKTIRWKPESTGTGRFGKWLEGLVDWNLSRSRFWGTPLPVWATEDYSEVKCIGSVEELMAEIERSIAAGVMQENPYRNFRVGDMSKENYSTENIDLHRPYVDSIVLVSSKGEPMRRESDLIDVWFDSGAMPYAQVHYPFENKEGFGQVYPADFIAQMPDGHHRLAIRVRPHPHRTELRPRTHHGHSQRLQRPVPPDGRHGGNRPQIPARPRIPLFPGQYRPKEEHARYAEGLCRIRTALRKPAAAAGRRPRGTTRGGDPAGDRRTPAARDAPPGGIYPQQRPAGHLQQGFGVPLHLAAREFRHPPARSDGLRHARGDIRYLGDPRSGGRRRHPRRPDRPEGNRRRPAAARNRRSVPRKASRLRPRTGETFLVGKDRPALAGTLRIAREDKLNTVLPKFRAPDSKPRTAALQKFVI